ncbi:hypothetical protein LL972_21565, partial [Xanthomonas campestris pv. asclepiadis]|uniref:hypothetical protein n=1 Tax=Xanthomonas campestris TaxID=339 RepID=UPI001E3D845D
KIQTRLSGTTRYPALSGLVVQTFPNVAAGLVSTFIFSVVLVILAVVVLKDPSPVALVRQLQELPNGK